ncbi:MAG: hypothetical protein IJM10_00325, partial [Clostridia bacterium]|nr:hypothetical protein [Clostridia bacterium]
HCFYKALYKDSGVVVIRYPRGSQPLLPDGFKSSENDYDIYGNALSSVVVITYGRLFSDILSISQKNGFKIIKLNKIKPLNSALVSDVINSECVFVVEECVKSGSIGEKIASVLLENGFKGRFFHKSIDDTFVSQADVSQQLHNYGLDALSLEKYIVDNINGVYND